MRFPDAGRAKKKDILGLADEVAGGQIDKCLCGGWPD